MRKKIPLQYGEEGAVKTQDPWTQQCSAGAALPSGSGTPRGLPAPAGPSWGPRREKRKSELLWGMQTALWGMQTCARLSAQGCSPLRAGGRGSPVERLQAALSPLRPVIHRKLPHILGFPQAAFWGRSRSPDGSPAPTHPLPLFYPDGAFPGGDSTARRAARQGYSGSELRTCASIASTGHWGTERERRPFPVPGTLLASSKQRSRSW